MSEDMLEALRVQMAKDDPCAPDPLGKDLTFSDFAAINRRRCEQDFHRRLDETNDHSLETWALKLVGEAGEVAEAVLRFGGKIARKAPVTAADIGDELADVVSYADLIASWLGLDLGEAVASKWNRVSDRIGSAMRIAPPMPGAPDVRARLAGAEAAFDRLRTIIDEAFGMQPVMSGEELLTFLEQRLFTARRAG